MAELHDEVLEEIIHEGKSMTLQDMLDIIERGHDDRPGVDQETIRTYTQELDDRRDYGFDVKQFLGDLDERLTDAETWEGNDHFYELGEGRISQFPALWHARLGGSDDVTAYLRFIREEQPEFVDDLNRGGFGSGIPEDTLVHILQVVGRLDRAAAMQAIEDARDRDVITEDVEQHPQAGIYLAERVRSGEVDELEE